MFDYEEEYGAVEINGSSVVVGDDWWLERREYDSSEWWEFKTMPEKPSVTREVEQSELKN